MRDSIFTKIASQRCERAFIIITHYTLETDEVFMYRYIQLSANLHHDTKKGRDRNIAQ